MTSNITFTKGSTVVTIFTTKVDETYTKVLTTIVPPTSSAKWSVGPKDTKIVDLLRITNRFEIDGYITADEGAYGSGDSSSTITGKRADLISIFKGGGSFTMNYGGTNYTVNAEKMSITEESEDSATATRYPLKISVIKGVNI